MFVPLSNRCRISQSTPLQGPTSSLAFLPFSNRCGTPQSTPLWSLASLLAHRIVSTPFGAQPHRLVSGSDTICNGPNPPLTDIVFFGLFLLGFPSMFLLGRDFHILIKNVSFPLSNRRRIPELSCFASLPVFHLS